MVWQTRELQNFQPPKPQRVSDSAALLNFPQPPTPHIIDKPPRNQFFGNPWMSAEFLQLVADVFFNVLESEKKRGRNRRRSRAILNAGAQFLLARQHQSTIGVIDDHDFLRFKQIVRNQQRPQAIVCDNPARVANDVGISVLKTQGQRREPRIHAGEYGDVPRGPRRKAPQLVRARIDVIGFENFVDHTHTSKV